MSKNLTGNVIIVLLWLVCTLVFMITLFAAFYTADGDAPVTMDILLAKFWIPAVFYKVQRWLANIINSWTEYLD